MPFDALSALRDAGSPIDAFTEDQRRVLMELTPREVAIWISIKERLEAAGGGDVAGQDLNMLL